MFQAIYDWLRDIFNNGMAVNGNLQQLWLTNFSFGESVIPIGRYLLFIFALVIFCSIVVFCFLFVWKIIKLIGGLIR